MSIKLGLWKNERREKATHPILSSGKPQVINGQEYWVKAFINAPKGDTELAERIEKFVTYLAERNQSYPIVNVTLSPAENRQNPAPQSSANDFPDFPDF